MHTTTIINPSMELIQFQSKSRIKLIGLASKLANFRHKKRGDFSKKLIDRLAERDKYDR
jgi:hypothetical protein